MKPIVIYINTSVFGGYFDTEFKEPTQSLFDLVLKGKYHILYSSVTEDELLKAPKRVKELLSKIPKSSKTFIPLTLKARKLGHLYISEKVVGKASRKDCYHIALATIHKVDALVSWDFRHIVNFDKIRGYNSINIKKGYSMINICSPKALIY